MPGYHRKVTAEHDFDVLLGLMVDMITAQARSGKSDTPNPEWTYCLHDLSLKLVKHLCSAKALLEPSRFQTNTLPPLGYIDHSSVAVIVRSSIENYLVMHWLYSRGDAELREFRHAIWKHSGLKKRAKTFASTDDGSEAKERAAKEAGELFDKIRELGHYQRLNKEQKKNVRKGKWDVDCHWFDLAVEAGWHRVQFDSIYHFLSGYTHSDYISSIQVSQAVTLQEQYNIGLSCIMTALMVVGHFAHFYASVFPAAKAVFDVSLEAKSTAEKWHFDAKDVAFIYGPVP